MLVIGIAGGIACGKSLVAAYFQQLGAHRLDVDRIGHKVLELPEVIDAIREQWGEHAFDDKGNIDRKSLGKIVFAKSVGDEPSQLEILERITHPQIAKIVNEQLTELRQRDEVPAVILDAPVMFKAGWDKLCDKIVFVEVPLELRREWASTRNWSHAELESREQQQVPVDVKRKRATDIIDNTGTQDQLFDQIVCLWNQWGFSSTIETLPNP